MATVTTMTSHHFVRQPIESTDGSMDSNDISNHYSGRESPLIDNNSCSSDDTVLSVGNENPPVPSDTLSFKNIESHLNAISNLTNSTLADVERKTISTSSTSPNSPLSSTTLLSPGSTKSISQSPTPSVYHMSDSKSNPTSPSPLFRPMCDAGDSAKSSMDPCYFRQTPMIKTNDNNEANMGGLKFSIDNILKADFGRRITDPINIKKSKVKKIAQPKVFDDAKTSSTTASTAASGPVDLSKTDVEKTVSSSSSTSSAEGSGVSQQPMLWPAWVYCTRYSDRPSSGRQQLH